MTRLVASLQGDLREFMAAETKAAERAVSRSINRAAAGLQREMRTQTRRAGLGQGVEKAWSTTRYPKRGTSIKAAAIVYSKARRIHEAFSADTTIRAKSAKWLVIPLDPAKREGLDRGMKHSQGSRPRKWSDVDATIRRGKLVFIQYKPDRAFLARPGTRGEKPVAYFLLVRQVRLSKRLDFDGPADRWANRLPGYILSEWERQSK